MLTHLSTLLDDPLSFVIRLLYLIPAILVSLTLHELAHGYVALWCGDPTDCFPGSSSLCSRPRCWAA